MAPGARARSQHKDMPGSSAARQKQSKLQQEDTGSTSLDTHNMEHEVASAKMSWSYLLIVTRAGKGRRVGRYSIV